MLNKFRVYRWFSGRAYIREGRDWVPQYGPSFAVTQRIMRAMYESKQIEDWRR